MVLSIISMITYDYVCVGGGPAGLTLVYTLGQLGYKCLLIDEHDSLGGCHRVDRVNGFFTEHSPRIYSSSYRNFMMILKDMNLNFEDLFTPYKFTISSIGGQGVTNFSFSELISLMTPFMKFFILDSNYGKTISMDSFMKEHHFSPQSYDYVDRLCRLTDGAGADRYTLFQFIQLINQQLLYTIYQPRYPNDSALFKVWKSKIEATGNVKILQGYKVNRLVNRTAGIISGLVAIKDGNEFLVQGHNFILAIPPKALVGILQNSRGMESAFGPLNEIQQWSQQTQYIDDIGIAFHWNYVVNLPDIYGFPQSDWGVAFIKLTDYMNLNDSRSQTMITTCTTKNDFPSKRTGKTANHIQTYLSRRRY
jgi:hypothetical protein